MQMTFTSQPIDYEPRDARRRAKARIRWIIGIALLMAIAGAWWQGPQTYEKIRRAYWQYRVENYVAPADRVVYEEDPARWPALLALPGYASMACYSTGPETCPFVAYMAQPVARLEIISGLRLAPTSLFAHSLKTPGGRQCLVDVWMAYNGIRMGPQGASPDNQVRFDLCTSVVDGTKLVDAMPSPWIAPQEIAEHRRTPLYARIFAGQIDPNDATHFTIPFEIGGYSDVLDGNLRDNLDVILRPRKLHHPLNPK